MTDRSVSIGCMVAYSLWVATLGLLVAAWITGDWRVGHTALASSAAAATASVRQFFVHQNKMLKRAFELGRDYGRSELRSL